MHNVAASDKNDFGPMASSRLRCAHLPMFPMCMASTVPTDSVQYEMAGSHSTAWHFLTVKTYLRTQQQRGPQDPDTADKAR